MFGERLNFTNPRLPPLVTRRALTASDAQHAPHVLPRAHGDQRPVRQNEPHALPLMLPGALEELLAELPEGLYPAMAGRRAVEIWMIVRQRQISPSSAIAALAVITASRTFRMASVRSAHFGAALRIASASVFPAARTTAY